MTGGAGFTSVPFSSRSSSDAAHRVRSGRVHPTGRFYHCSRAWGTSLVRLRPRRCSRLRRAWRRPLEGVSTSSIHLAAIVGDPACARDPELGTGRRIVDGDVNGSSTRRPPRGVRRFVFLSTCSNYGKMADPSAYVTEDSELRPVSLYAETKVEAER